MVWGLINASPNRVDEGKVFVESTPRIRSVDWSWIEEVKDSLLQLEKITASSKVCVTANKLNLRDQPDKKSSIITQLQNGENSIVKEKKGVWLKVEAESGKIGWIHAGYVEILSD